ncbi:pseudouridine synthase [Aquirufa ecclesiirivi]|uniref:pseudouridine synthase n=1 Tax=Aquirufa ecclesiirivi TaxID=2715124 RepID=UPI0022A86ACA|nr:pseudouridine synthase [Aquirufa ecclesiirivi]MCZ2473459.1 pseudouridine synthase [Aquirufa ecclesiirivi]
MRKRIDKNDGRRSDSTPKSSDDRRSSRGGERAPYAGSRSNSEGRPYSGPRSDSPRSFSGPRRDSGDSRRPSGDGERRPYSGPRSDSDRKPYEGNREGGERRSFSGPRRDSGDSRRPSGDGERRPYSGPRSDSDRKPYEGNREGGERRSFSGPRRDSGDTRRPSGDGERRPYSGPRNDSDRKPYEGNREGGERRSFSGPRRDSGDTRRPSGDGERRPYSGPRNDSDRKPYEGNREGGERRSFSGPRRDSGETRRPSGDGERRPYSGPRSDSDRKPYEGNREGGERRSFSGPRRDSGDTRRPFGDRERRPYDANREFSEDKPFVPKEDFRSEPNSEQGNDEVKPRAYSSDRTRPDTRREDAPESRDFSEGRNAKFSKRDTFKSRNRYEEKPAFTPQYKLDRFREKAPARIQKKFIQEERKNDSIRLNRYIANAGICSRRDADKLIEAGEIKVNNKVITEMGYQVQPTDIVKYGNRKLNREKPVYVLLNKPKDFLTTTEDPNDRKTVMELVKNAGDARIYPVGRLDRNTTGLILLTNDGELADKLTHPSNEIEKIYQAELDKPLTDEDLEKIKAGLTLEDGEIKVDDIAKVTPDGYVVGVKIHSGKNRIVRRIFEHVGYEVTKLDRTTFAGLNKKDLPRGNWRYLSERELVKLKYLM